MATLTAGRLCDWIERLFDSHRNSSTAVFEIERARYTAIRRLVHDEHLIPEEGDNDWLERPELRGAEAVIARLDRADIAQQQGRTQALFLDARCGLIRSYEVSRFAEDHGQRVVPEILAEASNCHAEGIILATNDLKGTVRRRVDIQELTNELCRKGDAIDVYLLDHFVLTSRGWKRLPPSRKARR